MRRTVASIDAAREPEPGRLHHRARRRPRLERAERRAVPVVVRPGGGDRPGTVRAPTVGDDELPLADRRPAAWRHTGADRDRKSTRLNSSHANISYAVFCLKK